MLARALALCPSGAAVTITVLQSGGGLQGLLLIGPRPGGPAGPAPLSVPDERPSHGLGGPTPGSRLADDLAAAGWTVTMAGNEILAEARWEDRA
jgi:hypothetical protein